MHWNCLFNKFTQENRSSQKISGSETKKIPYTKFPIFQFVTPPLIFSWLVFKPHHAQLLFILVRGNTNHLLLICTFSPNMHSPDLSKLLKKKSSQPTFPGNYFFSVQYLSLGFGRRSQACQNQTPEVRSLGFFLSKGMRE